MARLSLGPGIQARSIHNDLSVGRHLNVSPIHRARRRTLEVDPFAVVAAAVAGTLEFVFAGLPIRGAAEMRTACINNKEAIGSAVHPDAVLLLKLGVYAKRVIRRIADLENRGRLKKGARKKKAKESDKPGAKKRGDAAPNQPAASFVGGARLRPNGSDTACGGRFGRADGGGADILGRVRFVSVTGSGSFHRFRFLFDRLRFRRRHEQPPRLCTARNSYAPPASAPLFLCTAPPVAFTPL